MSENEQYLYKGTYCSAGFIAEAEKIPKDSFCQKFKELGDVVEAIQAIKPSEPVTIPDKYQGMNLIITFEEPIKSVMAEMQPSLGKLYVAELCRSWQQKKRTNNGARTYYVIRLENGKALIVYPGEFRIISAA